MGSVINYSFIIPHKNSPQYLNRCLNSIPRRDDIQIIVVDDNSDSTIIDWNAFSFEDCRNIELVLTKEGRGAGYARNVGLARARGKWLLFPDADDYYEDGFLKVLDKYIESDLDVLYFNFTHRDEEGNKLCTKLNKYVSDCTRGEKDVDYVKYKINVPWNKMVRRAFVEQYMCTYEEIPKANDMFFTFQVGYFAKKVDVIDIYLYNYIVYRSSQTNINWNESKIQCFLENFYKNRGFFEFIKHPEWVHGNLYIIWQILKFKSFCRGVRVIKYWFLNYKSISKSKSKYADIFKVRTQIMGTR